MASLTSKKQGHFISTAVTHTRVNMAETDITRMTSDYADNELELFRKTLDLIVSSENGKASSTDILNSTDTMTSKKLKKSETEHLLTRLVQDNWLCERRGEYTLSTRCIIEMEPYIRTMYQEQVKVCHICHNIAFQCQICENPSCGIKIHNPCVARYFKGRVEPHCPACDDFWPHEIPGTNETSRYQNNVLYLLSPTRRSEVARESTSVLVGLCSCRK
uniref:Non-structural maintenance of chromosomes element 1 homolog n=1 Tax=Xiphophorus couchianus TaxID=32473 RepID=A0A3B5MIZ5_9TELE